MNFGLLCTTTVCFVLTCNAQDLRRCGTNIFDFGPVTSSANSPFNLTGTVDRVLSSGDWILTQRSGTDFQYTPSSAALASSTPSELLLLLSAARRAQNPRRITLGEYLAMSPEMRVNFQPVQITEKLYILNPPAPTNPSTLAAIRAGKPVLIGAVPSRSVALADYGVLKTYDCGVPIQKADLNDGDTIFRLTQSGLVRTMHRTHISLEAEGQTRAAIARLRIEQDATNGVASAQFDLGLRYWNGDGLPANRPVGLGWINRAGYQDYPAALKFLKDHETEVDAILAPARNSK